MTSRHAQPHFQELQDLVREYLTLERMRSSEALLGPRDHARWREVRDRLDWLIHDRQPDEGSLGAHRGALRVPTQLEVKFSDGARLDVGCSVEISTDGLFLATETPAEPGTWLELALEGDPGDDPIPAHGEVVWARPLHDDLGPAGMGIRFERLGDRQRGAIEGRVAHALCTL